MYQTFSLTLPKNLFFQKKAAQRKYTSFTKWSKKQDGALVCLCVCFIQQMFSTELSETKETRKGALWAIKCDRISKIAKVEWSSLSD